MSKTIRVMAFAVAPAFLTGAAIADETAPDVLAASCVACHGTSGRSSGAIPSLTDLEADDVKRMLADFRSGAAESTVMGRISKGYTDAEIAAIATEIASWGE